MFSRKEKPLPQAVLKPVDTTTLSKQIESGDGIHLGNGCYWNPEALPNGHIVAIGASGSGKTQTLKAIAYGLSRTYPDMQVILIDFHGDQKVLGETIYPLHMASPYGINPLLVNLDPEGGGPNLQAIAVAAVLKKALQLGPIQEGLMLDILAECYKRRSVFQEAPETWRNDPPNFDDVQQAIESRITYGCKDSQKLKLKLAATFQYGIFSRPTFPLEQKLIRIDLCKLPPALGAIAAESLARQLMDSHRLMGEIEGKLPRTYLFIDEAKEMPKVSGSACDRIIADGRKYGLALALASQSERHLSLDVIGNSASKIVLPVDQTEVKRVSNKFRFAEGKVAGLAPLNALCRFGAHAEQVSILPYYQRVQIHE
ncbi:ATP-binding protein [Aliterella atlantica]|uniref:Cell division protein FtsK n=1 Tax=Aliterella atlantica CENA595 TaxID=1618023 RepID=A0A0D8ZN77_9CYAN|nr:ATP-binding protein [Aliterella atlantica]KJH70258.1 cell division protein FtsK [Aliterella atlantica CENA595]